jgi:hypothetical protein
MKSQKIKAPASAESMMEGKKNKCGIIYPFAAETRGSNATSLQTHRKMQQAIYQFKEEKTWSFVSRKSRC